MTFLIHSGSSTMPIQNAYASPEIIEVDGQFDDAPTAPAAPAIEADPREGHRFIDDDALLEWSSSSSSDDDEPDEFEEEEDNMEAAAFHTLRAEDEDWEIAERDFTKQYNRLKQHVAVRTGAAQGVASAFNARAAVASLPAVNRPRPAKARATAAVPSPTNDRTENQLQALSKYTSRLRNLDMPYDLGVGVNRKGPSATANMKDKSDRATNEQVLDPRTRIILFKMIGRSLIFEVNGCVSTGKEANVYHALTPEKTHLALKIYKTSILVFKDRDRPCVKLDMLSRHNPRKMVRVWAEKEMRNLKRLRAAGIRCPEAIEVRENVLVMGFVGDKDGWASPRLKDAEIPASIIPDLYVELLLMTRKIYTECKLVHADLSEYNILYHVEDAAADSPAQDDSQPGATSEQTNPESPRRGHLYIIDVSQSVEHDHPHAFDFLRADLRNVEDFFARRGVRCVGLRRAFEFVTSEQLALADGGESEEAVLRRWMEEPEPDVERADESKAGETSGNSEPRPSSAAAAAHEDSVFMRSYIPRTLNEVYDPERDVRALASGDGGNLIYKDMIGLVGPQASRSNDTVESETEALKTDGKAESKKNRVRFEDEGDEDGDDSAEEGEEGSEGSDEEDGDFEERKPRGHRHEDKDAKKERKKAVKAEAREKRKHKIPKAEKKRKVKATARGDNVRSIASPSNILLGRVSLLVPTAIPLNAQALTRLLSDVAHVHDSMVT
ncbi:Serine/threonine-protein kinase rio1 [Grifola frondosa]|uniref:Serine/threonine-protein kinase RIO1 n=1 Tax=Grifola frondosa TaxID=5627 RepID=A0A1C7M436_GRIFR|nr:Serine/threonine-protein kinase rio1 [Grifola frondosa]